MKGATVGPKSPREISVGFDIGPCLEQGVGCDTRKGSQLLWAKVIACCALCELVNAQTVVGRIWEIVSEAESM